MSVNPADWTAPANPPAPAPEPAAAATAPAPTPAPAAGSVVRYQAGGTWHYGLVVAGTSADDVQAVPLGPVTVHPEKAEPVT